jgi:hypothetical protein
MTGSGKAGRPQPRSLQRLLDEHGIKPFGRLVQTKTRFLESQSEAAARRNELLERCGLVMVGLAFCWRFFLKRLPLLSTLLKIAIALLPSDGFAQMLALVSWS